MTKQVFKLGARILENLPAMSPDVMQGWIENPKALQDFLRGLAPPVKVSPPHTSHLRHLKSLTLAPTKGTVTIAAAQEIFTGYLDPDFRFWGTNQSGADTEMAKVDIHEMSHQNGNFRTLFGSLGADPRSHCLSQGQIVDFSRTHREHLRKEGYSTFFPFAVKRVNEEEYDLFVAHVNERGGKLNAYVNRFERGLVWIAGNRYRLVVRQQTV